MTMAMTGRMSMSRSLYFEDKGFGSAIVRSSIRTYVVRFFGCSIFHLPSARPTFDKMSSLDPSVSD